MSEYDDQTRVPQSEPPAVEEPFPVGEDTDPSGESVVEEEVEGDPFAGWPAAESAAVIEDTPQDGASVEHVRGEARRSGSAGRSGSSCRASTEA